jgi:MoxR-like ATPase
MAEIEEAALVGEGVIPPDDFHDNIERVRDVAAYDLEMPADLRAAVLGATHHLLVPERTVMAAAVALSVGHLVLQGPPGTGKSSLARALAQAYHATLLQVTAHGDWSTFEVIGRQELRVNADGNEEIVAVNGAFTEAAVKCAGQIVRHFDAPTEPQATWLMIDELNRAQPDRAFGELFSILGTDDLVPVNLSFQREGNRELVTPRRLRIIATVNSIDRQYVNNLGQGLKRRFTFVTVDIPAKRRPGESWFDEAAGASDAIREVGVAMAAAAQRVARRLTGPDQQAEVGARTTQLLERLRTDGATGLRALFDLVETVRYVAPDAATPFVPIGTAQVIDTIELFLANIEVLGAAPGEAIDQAVAAKLAPLFDSDAVSPVALTDFSAALQSPFDTDFRRELRAIAAAGMGYVG